MVIAFLFGPIQSASSQTEKGTHIYGGGLSLQSLPYYGMSFSFTPMYGYFPVNNFGIIGKLNVIFSPYYSGGLQYGGGPELRYYVGGEKVKFFVFGNAIPGACFTGGNYHLFTISTGGGPGLAVFPTSGFAVNVAMELGYNRNYQYSQGGFVLGLNTSFTGLFSPKRKEKTVKI